MNEPLVAYDCSNDHHGRECGRRPCGCECHADRKAAPDHAEEATA